MERRYARFRRAPLADHTGAAEVPDNGMCLSVFLVLESPDRPGSVLAGQIDPAGPWWEVGAVDPRRVAMIGERWMLPSCQLLLFESPADAAQRILREQLGSGPIPLEGPAVFSDPSLRPTSPGKDPHWDIHFVYRGRWTGGKLATTPVWKRLDFLDVARTARSQFARDQGDVLELVGLPPKD
jgi:ADP-ribose pyrophosphatase YjhB (NUDIX family)